MKRLSTTLILTIFSIHAFGQIKTDEVEIRAATGSWINEIKGNTLFGGTHLIDDIHSYHLNFNPTYTYSGSGIFTRAGLHLNLGNTFNIPSGLSDNGTRTGLVVSTYIKNANFQGYLKNLRGATIHFGADEGATGGAIDQIIGLYLNGHENESVNVGNAFALYQLGSTYQNFFEGNMRISNDENDSDRLRVDLKTASNNKGIELTANDIGTDSYWIHAASNEISDAFVVRGDGRVGVGTNDPTSKLTVFDSNFELTGNQGLLIGGSSGGLGNYTPAIGFSNTINSMDAAIAGVQELDQNRRMGLAFFVKNSGNIDVAKSEKMRLTRLGRLGIGTADPTGILEVAHTGNSELVVSGGGSGFSNAGLVLKATQGTGSRATGVYMHDVGEGTEWYAGRPYQGSDKYVIYRNANATSHTHESSGLANGQGLSTGVESFFTIKADGKIGIGTNEPSEKLEVNGDVKANAFDASSDGRWKKDISMISNAQQTLNGIRPVSYQWRVNEFPDKDFDTELHYGVIAQELEKVLPELVSTDNEGYKSVDYLGMIGLLVKGFQERGAEIARLNEELSAKTASNKDELATLESRLARLEALLGAEDQESKDSSTSEK